MKTITTKLNYKELQCLALMLWNLSAMLMQSTDNLDRLSGIMMNECHHRLNRKLDFIFSKPKTVSFSMKECLVLHQFLNDLDIPEMYAHTVRINLFALIDKQMVNAQTSHA